MPLWYGQKTNAEKFYSSFPICTIQIFQKFWVSLDNNISYIYSIYNILVKADLLYFHIFKLY